MTRSRKYMCYTFIFAVGWFAGSFFTVMSLFQNKSHNGNANSVFNTDHWFTINVKSASSPSSHAENISAKHFHNSSILLHRQLPTFPSILRSDNDEAFVVLDWPVDDKLFTQENYLSLESFLVNHPESKFRSVILCPWRSQYWCVIPVESYCPLVEMRITTKLETCFPYHNSGSILNLAMISKWFLLAKWSSHEGQDMALVTGCAIWINVVTPVTMTAGNQHTNKWLDLSVLWDYSSLISRFHGFLLTIRNDFIFQEYRSCATLSFGHVYEAMPVMAERWNIFRFFFSSSR